MNKARIDNSYLEEKIQIRLENLPDKREIKVLDLFHGNGMIWNNIKKRSKKNIFITGIDIKRTSKADLIGDNLKFIDSLTLEKYDVFDLDDYGIPYKQLDKLFNKVEGGGHYFVTFNRTVFGRLPIKMLIDIGYSRTMIKKCLTLFDRNGFEKFCLWLSMNGIKEIKYIDRDSKKYIYFKR